MAGLGYMGTWSWQRLGTRKRSGNCCEKCELMLGFTAAGARGGCFSRSGTRVMQWVKVLEREMWNG